MMRRSWRQATGARNYKRRRGWAEGIRFRGEDLWRINERDSPRSDLYDACSGKFWAGVVIFPVVGERHRRTSEPAVYPSPTKGRTTLARTHSHYKRRRAHAHHKVRGTRQLRGSTYFAFCLSL